MVPPWPPPPPPPSPSPPEDCHGTEATELEDIFKNPHAGCSIEVTLNLLAKIEIEGEIRVLISCSHETGAIILTPASHVPVPILKDGTY